MKYIVLALLATYAFAATAGMYELTVGEDYDYSLMDEDDRMIGFSWADFKITRGEKIEKATIYISTTKNALGKWQGAWGSSTTVAADGYWTMTDDMAKSFTTNSGSITWEVDAATAKIIQQAYGGELKWGVWWIDCNDFTIEKVVVYTDAYKGGDDAGDDEKEIKAVKEAAGVYTAKVGAEYVYKSLGTDKMLPLNWEWFDIIPKTEVITQIDVNLSTTAAKLGKWQGAFGSSTGIAPDYWIMTDDMSETLTGTTGTVSWEVDSATNKAIRSATGGQLKFGVWWIDCNTFTIESVTIHTDAEK